MEPNSPLEAQTSSTTFDNSSSFFISNIMLAALNAVSHGQSPVAGAFMRMNWGEYAQYLKAKAQTKTAIGIFLLPSIDPPFGGESTPKPYRRTLKLRRNSSR
jgi:hypothetical protein